MKKVLFLMSAMLIITLSSFSQANFQWEKTDSVGKTKDQIYADTKMFIAQTWKSAKDVIQNDDKESGVILIKGLNTQIIPSGSFSSKPNYYFKYNVTFRMKDNKYRISINNVECIEASYRTYNYKLIQPFDGGEENAPSTAVLSKKKSVEMMVSLRNDLQSIVDQYMLYIKTPKAVDNF
jgi:hypothetical protein